MSRGKAVREVKKVLGYVRVSTGAQADSGAGLESQKAAIEAECNRRGWQLVEIIEDAGLSGKGMARPGLQRGLEALMNGQADALVCSKLDRLSRSVKDFAELVDMSTHYGWKLIILDCQVDTSTPAGEMLAGVMVQFAQFERRMIGQRTKDALAVKKAQGVKLGRRPEIEDSTAAKIESMRAQGMTLRGIADALNIEGVQTARQGAKWYASTVRVVLEREAA